MNNRYLRVHGGAKDTFQRPITPTRNTPEKREDDREGGKEKNITDTVLFLFGCLFPVFRILWANLEHFLVSALFATFGLSQFEVVNVFFVRLSALEVGARCFCVKHGHGTLHVALCL